LHHLQGNVIPVPVAILTRICFVNGFLSPSVLLSTGRVSQLRTLTPNFTVVTLTAPKSPKLVILGINLPKTDFYRIWLGEEVPGSYPHAKFHHCGFKNLGLQPPKSPKLVFFRLNLPKMGIPP